MKEIKEKMAELNKYEDLLFIDNTQIQSFIDILNNLIESLNKRRFDNSEC
jgi:hypothetical protein